MKHFYLLIFLFCIQSIFSISITLNKRQQCDLELLACGGFKPLTSFMNQQDYDLVLEHMRLKDGSLWPMPITLDIDKDIAQGISKNSILDLRSEDGTILAQLTVSDVWQPNKKYEAQRVFGTTSKEHPGVAYLFEKTKQFYVGGSVKKIVEPVYYRCSDLYHTPEQLKTLFQKKGLKKIIGFQTRNPMHRVHKEITSRAMEEIGGHLLLHPIVGETKPGDVDSATRIRCYKKILKYYPEDSVTLSLLPLAMRMAGPREALWHAIIRKNYGCTHFIIGRDHAGPGKDKNGNPFYEPYAAQQLVKLYQEEIGIKVVPFNMMAYVQELDQYLSVDQIQNDLTVHTISGTKLHQILQNHEDIPEWFSFPDILEELKKAYKPKSSQGFTVFLTGLCASGKSSIAQALKLRLSEIMSRPITILDGDIIRKNLSKGLGFSKKDRSINVRRVGFVAKEITKHGGIAICALVSPYNEDRFFNRKEIENHGAFIEIYVATPLDICEQRDPKGLYVRARAGEIKQFTGIDDPYEAPKNPELVIDTANISLKEAVEEIVYYLTKENYI